MYYSISKSRFEWTIYDFNKQPEIAVFVETKKNVFFILCIYFYFLFIFLFIFIYYLFIYLFYIFNFYLFG